MLPSAQCSVVMQAASPVRSLQWICCHGAQVLPWSFETVQSCLLGRTPSLTGSNNGLAGSLRSNQVVKSIQSPDCVSARSAEESEPGVPFQLVGKLIGSS